MHSVVGENGGVSSNPESAASAGTPDDDASVIAGRDGVGGSAAAGGEAAQTRPGESEGQPAPAEEQATVTAGAVRVQRSPRYFRFMLTGALVFAVVALVLTFSFPENPTYDRGAVFGFLLAICATVGVTLGALLALVLDRAATRRARTVQADRIDVRVPAAEPEKAGHDDDRPATES